MPCGIGRPGEQVAAPQYCAYAPQADPGERGQPISGRVAEQDEGGPMQWILRVLPREQVSYPTEKRQRTDIVQAGLLRMRDQPHAVVTHDCQAAAMSPQRPVE